MTQGARGDLSESATPVLPLVNVFEDSAGVTILAGRGRQQPTLTHGRASQFVPTGRQTRSSQIPGHLFSQRAGPRCAAVIATVVPERSGDAGERAVTRPRKPDAPDLFRQ
ncbi:MAG: hypothetical protein ABI606_02680, partial [Rhodoferax sp.]